MNGRSNTSKGNDKNTIFVHIYIVSTMCCTRPWAMSGSASSRDREITEFFFITTDCPLNVTIVPKSAKRAKAVRVSALGQKTRKVTGDDAMEKNDHLVPIGRTSQNSNFNRESDGGLL
jgi:hypothetical protein